MISVAEHERLRSKRSFQEAYQRFLRKHSLAEAGVAPAFARKLRDRSSGRKVHW